MTEAKTRCIECGGFVGSLNEDEDGNPCSACAERLLETLPGVFHQSWTETAAQDNAVEQEEEYADGAYADGPSAERSDEEPTDRGRFGE